MLIFAHHLLIFAQQVLNKDEHVIPFSLLYALTHFMLQPSMLLLRLGHVKL